MSDEDEDLREIQGGIDAERERRQRVRDAIGRLRSTSPYALNIDHRAERGATGEMFITVGDDERRIFGDPVYADEDGTLTTVNPNPPSGNVPSVDDGPGIRDPSFGASDLRGWVDEYDRRSIRLRYSDAPPIPVIRRTIGDISREESARIARHFYRQRDAALRRVRELEAALEEAHKRMIRFRMRIDGCEA